MNSNLRKPPSDIIYDQKPASYPVINDIDEMCRLARQGLRDTELVTKLLRNKAEINLDHFITSDPLMMEQKRRVELILSLPYNKLAPVLITGPSGTGKEIIARAFEVYNQPFIARNCAGFPKDLIASLLFGHTKGTFTGAHEDRQGIFVKAAEGVVFLDEIAELPLDAQAILLRTLQNRTVCQLGSIDEIEIKCRIVAATKRNLRQMVSEGTFREDLFARLMTFEITLTSLSERVPDIALIAKNGLDLNGEIMAYDAPIPEHIINSDIKIYNVRAIQTYVQRMRTYGNY